MVMKYNKSENMLKKLVLKCIKMQRKTPVGFVFALFAYLWPVLYMSDNRNTVHVHVHICRWLCRQAFDTKSHLLERYRLVAKWWLQGRYNQGSLGIIYWLICQYFVSLLFFNRPSPTDRPTDRLSQERGGWETKHFMGMAYSKSNKNNKCC